VIKNAFKISDESFSLEIQKLAAEMANLANSARDESSDESSMMSQIPFLSDQFLELYKRSFKI